MGREAQFPDFAVITGNLGSSCFSHRLSASLSTFIHQCLLTLEGTTYLDSQFFFWILWCELDFSLGTCMYKLSFLWCAEFFLIAPSTFQYVRFCEVSILFLTTLGAHGFVSLKKCLIDSQDGVETNVFATLCITLTFQSVSISLDQNISKITEKSAYS